MNKLPLNLRMSCNMNKRQRQRKKCSKVQPMYEHITSERGKKMWNHWGKKIKSHWTHIECDNRNSNCYIVFIFVCMCVSVCVSIAVTMLLLYGCLGYTYCYRFCHNFVVSHHKRKSMKPYIILLVPGLRGKR